ncbi:MAG: molybdate ABC transporter permease subunit, partial [Limnobacter sp.]|nr:molybdate ABC transporter permease subunit [Limnobacter sp.]
LSFKLALSTVLVLFPLGLLVGRFLALSTSKLKPWLEACILLPLVLPPTVLGFYLLAAFSPISGFGQWVQQWFGVSLAFEFSGLLLASLLFNLPFMIQPIQRALEAVPRDLLEAAQVCGLSRLQSFLQVELPLAWSGLATGVLLTFVHTLGEFGVVLMIGGSIPGKTQTLSIAIYDSVQAFDTQSANQMALSLLAFALVAVALTYLISSKARRVHR